MPYPQAARGIEPAIALCAPAARPPYFRYYADYKSMNIEQRPEESNQKKVENAKKPRARIPRGDAASRRASALVLPGGPGHGDPARPNPVPLSC